MTTDGLRLYLEAVEGLFGADIDYAQLVKIYGTEELPNESRYSPPKCLGARPTHHHRQSRLSAYLYKLY